jgi:hypothetical protein
MIKRFFSLALLCFSIGAIDILSYAVELETTSELETEFEVITEITSEDIVESEVVIETTSEDIVETEVVTETTSELETESEVVTETTSELETESEVVTETTSELETESEVFYYDDNYFGPSDFSLFLSSLSSELKAVVSPSSRLLSSPYYDYLVSYAMARPPLYHYVCYVTSRYMSNRTYYYYNIAISDNLLYNGSSFSGNVTIYSIRDDATISVSSDSSFVLNPGNSLVFTDLDSHYPDICSPFRFNYALFFVITIVILYYVFTQFFGNLKSVKHKL